MLFILKYTLIMVKMEFPDLDRGREVQVQHDLELNLQDMCFHFGDVFDGKLEKKRILLPVVLPAVLPIKLLVNFQLTSGSIPVGNRLEQVISVHLQKENKVFDHFRSRPEVENSTKSSAFKS